MLRAGDLAAGQRVHRGAAAPAAPAVTVVMPTWSRAAGGLLQRALASVVEQTFGDLELIVVDDGSVDATEDVVRELQRRDPRIVYVRHDLNCGLPALRVNEGIELARGRWVAFQFDDDRWTPGALAALTAVAREQSEPAVTFGSARLRFPGGVEETLPDVPVNTLTLSFRNRIANNSVLVPRQLFERHGLYDCHVAMRRISDWDLWLRLARFVPFVAVEELVSEVSVLADDAALGGAFPYDPALFRFLQAIPRNRLLLPGHWRDYVVDASSIAGVEVAGPLRARLEEQHAAPFRRRLRHAFPQLSAGTQVSSSLAPRPMLVTMDSFYPSFEMCAGHYDMLASQRGLPKMHYRPLLELDARWPEENELLLLVRTTLEPAVRVLQEARAAGVPAGYYLDDDLLHLHEYGGMFAGLSPGSERYGWLQAQLAEADAVWVTSPVIAESVAPLNPRLVPHHGAIRESWLPTRLHPRAEDGVLRIGYTGAGYRVEEFATIWSALTRLSAELGDRIELEFWGIDPTGLPPLSSPATFRPFMNGFGEFASRLRRTRLDVQLVPLLTSPRPRLAKAPSRYYYVAVTGSLGIFSDVAVYADLPAGISCLKVKGEGPGPWYAALREAIEMPVERFDAMRWAAIEHVRLDYTEHAAIHLHEAAVRATAFHAATRSRRVDGRPTVLFVFGGDASADDDDGLLRTVLVARAYGIAPRALCAGDAIALQARLDRAGVPWQAVPRPLLAASPPAGCDNAPLSRLLCAEVPALVQASADIAALSSACRDLSVPWMTGAGWQSANGGAFRRGLERVLAGELERAADPRDWVVATIADLEPYGGQLSAIEALAASSGGQRWRLRIWGSGAVDPAYANRCRRRAYELGVEDRVEVLRPLEDEPRMLADADLLLDLSAGERLPAAVALAAAAAVPVLSSSPGAFAAGLVDNVTAWRLPSTSVEEVGAATARVLALPGRARHGVARRAYRWARSELHPQRAASELLGRYGGLLGLTGGLGIDRGADAPGPPDAIGTAAAPASPAGDTVGAGGSARWRPRVREAAKAVGVYRPLSRAYWRTRRKQVLVLAEQEGVSLDLHYRRVLPELERATGRRWHLRRPAQVLGDDLYSYHAVIAVRGTSADCAALLARARQFGCRTVYDADDHLLLLEQAIADADNPWRRAFAAARPEIEGMLRGVDVVKTYADSAAPYYAQLNPRVVAIRAPHTALTSRPAAPPGQRPLKVGFVGSSYKDEELAPVLPAILRLLDERLPLCFEFFGFLPAALRDEPRVAHVPFRMPYQRFRDLFERLEWDIGLAPLRDLACNRCKSDNKYREYGSARVAGIYADMPVYRAAVRHRETGLLVAPTDPEGWYAAIRELAEDDALRTGIAERAYADVRANYRAEAYAEQVGALLEGPWPPPARSA